MTLPTPEEIAREAYPSPHEAFDAARIAAAEGAAAAYAAVREALEAEAAHHEAHGTTFTPRRVRAFAARLPRGSR